MFEGIGEDCEGGFRHDELVRLQAAMGPADVVVKALEEGRGHARQDDAFRFMSVEERETNLLGEGKVEGRELCAKHLRHETVAFAEDCREALLGIRIKMRNDHREFPPECYVGRKNSYF